MEWDGMEGILPPDSPLEAPMMSPGVQHMLKGSLVNMEGDQGSQGVLKPPVGSSISEEIGTLWMLPPPPP